MFSLASHLFQALLAGQAPPATLPPPPGLPSSRSRVRGLFGGVKLGDGLWIPMPGSKPFSIHRNSFHLYPEISFLFQFILGPIKTYLELQGRKRPDFLSSAESYSLGKGWAKLQTLSDQGVWGPEPCHTPYQKAWCTSSAVHECELASWPCCQYNGFKVRSALWNSAA